MVISIRKNLMPKSGFSQYVFMGCPSTIAFKEMGIDDRNK